MCVTFLVKYILFFVNLVFTLAGAALVGVGVAVLLQIKDILELIPVNLNAIPITVIVLGCVIFAIGFCGCFGAIKESQCLLTMYAVVMAVLAGGKIYFATVVFNGLSNIKESAQEWVVDAFQNHLNLFPSIEYAFSCCGTTGPSSYDGILATLPPTCCPNPSSTSVCPIGDAFDGCVGILGDYFETFGEAIAGMLIFVITAELVAVVFSLFLCCMGGKRR